MELEKCNIEQRITATVKSKAIIACQWDSIKVFKEMVVREVEQATKEERDINIVWLMMLAYGYGNITKISTDRRGLKTKQLNRGVSC